MSVRKSSRRLPTLTLIITLAAASAPAAVASAQSQGGDLAAFLAQLESIGASEVHLSPPNDPLVGYAERLETALELQAHLADSEAEGHEPGDHGWRALRLVADARSYSEAKLLARIAYGEPGSPPSVPRELSDDPRDPDWEFEDSAPSFPEHVTEALRARRTGRDRVVDEMSDQDFDTYAQIEELIYRAQRAEAAAARGRTFDAREDLYIAVLNNGQSWRRKKPVDHVPSTVERGEAGGQGGSDEGFPELTQTSAPTKVILGDIDNRSLRSQYNGFTMSGYVWRPKGALISQSAHSNGDPIDVSCTGVKISERLVVTAGHCLFDEGSWTDLRKWVPGADGIAESMGVTNDPSPNGYKISIMLEEVGLPYTVIPVDIGKGDQFTPEFLKLSPNNKMPAIVDHDGPGGRDYPLFESGAILMYLAEKTGQLMPSGVSERYRVVEWLMFQMGGVGPMLGQTHHFRAYAPEPIPYAIDRYTREAGRVYGVLDRRLGEVEYLAGDYSIADIATFPWLRSHERQGQKLEDFPNVKRWFEAINARPAVARGLQLLAEKRSAGPMDEKTKEMLFGDTQYERR